MTILILNWRDPQNPRSGGAEKITAAYADYWASLGHQVLWISNSFSGSKSPQVVNHVTYLRIGPKLGYGVAALLLTYPIFLVNAIYKTMTLLGNRRIDLIIDEIHGLPFFTPLYSRTRNVLLVCEVAGEIWNKMFPFPVDVVGKFFEKVIYRLYRRTETWAISQNTARDVVGLNSSSNIKILPLGVNLLSPVKLPKYSYPSAVFLGRLVKMKGVESAILAVRDIVKTLPDFRLSIIGNGSPEYIAYLRHLTETYHISANVIFYGFLKDSARNEIVSRSHFLIHPSFKEGFGLTVIEAGLLGTPTIGRHGSSLDEIINDKIDGYLFSGDSTISTLFTAHYQGTPYLKLRAAAINKSRRYLWSSVLSRSDRITGLR